VTDLEPPDFASLTTLQQVGWGARYALRGARIIVGHPSLWGYVLAPVALMGTAFVMGSGFVLWFVGWVTSWVWVPGPDTSATAALLYTVALWGLRLGLVASLLLLLYLTAGLIATPFNDRLSDQIERKLLRTGAEEWTFDQFLRDLGWSLAHSALSLVVYLLVMGVLLLLNLLPGVGSAVAFVVGSGVSAAFFAREAMDGSFSRRRMGYLEKWRMVMAHWPLTLGFGLCVSAAMWLPLLNFLVLPMSVAGGTVLFCHLERAGRTRPNLLPEVPDVGQDAGAHG
jgi:CysZ protein